MLRAVRVVPLLLVEVDGKQRDVTVALRGGVAWRRVALCCRMT